MLLLQKHETRLSVQGREARWSGNHLDIPNAHFLPYMDVKGVCHTQPWPSHHVRWSTLTLWMSTYGILRGGVMHIYSQRANKCLQAMEISIHTYSQVDGEAILFPWLGILSPYSAYKVNIFMGANGSIFPTFGSIARNYIGHHDILSLIMYRAILEEQFKAIVKPLHQNITLLILIRSVWPN